MDPEPIVAEWRRLLRPEGQILIWWVPWLNPWGHHIESLIPIPWAHVFFSDKTLTRACARVYDLPEFEPRVWDLDEDGAKKPNKWQAMSRLPEVNRLTIRAFEHLARHSGLEIHERLIHGFSGGRLSRATRFMTRLPLLGEFFTACVTYRLSSAGLF